MIDPDDVPPVDDEELLARYILNSNEFRKSDNTVKPKLFLPYSREVSVNRHRDCTEQEIWYFGTNVARLRNKTLYGRSDIRASSCRIAPLDVEPEPLPDNPNHANITGYPEKKEDQKSLALELAAVASKRILPPD